MMLRMVLEAAFRSLLMGLAVWGGMRLLQVRAVLAQKVAWVLVLLAAGVMPLAMRLPWAALDRMGIQGLEIPVRPLPGGGPLAHSPMSPLSDAGPATPFLPSRVLPRPVLPSPDSTVPAVKPSAVHRYKSIAMLSSYGALTVPQSLPPRLSAPPARVSQQTSSLPGAAAWNWQRFRAGLAWLYLAVACILLLRMGAGLMVAYGIWHRSKAMNCALMPFQGTAVRVSDELSTPVTIGSTVILPADCAGWDQAKLRIVLAHERSHVRQRDFYLQLAAAIHAAIFWFSPLGWWLQRRLSDLGEALSDRAGLEQASNASSYAQVLLEFAARPHRNSYKIPFAGVAMARTTNLSSRIERVLNARLFRAAFTGGQRHAVLAAVLVPAVLLAVIAGIRIVPRVETRVEAARASQAGSDLGSGQSASQSQAPSQAPAQTPSQTQAWGQSTAAGSSGSGSVQAGGATTGQISSELSGQVTSTQNDQAANPGADQVAPPPPPPPAVPEPADAAQIRAAEAVAVIESDGHRGYSYGYNDDGDAYAIVHENSDKTIRMSGSYNDEFAKVRKNLHGNYIWFERDGKSYVITDPAVIAKSEALFKGNSALDIRLKVLDNLQPNLNVEMAKIQPQIDIKLDSPEFKAEMEKLKVELKQLDTVKIKEITDKVNTEVLEDLQDKMAEIQGHIGEIQGKIGEEQGRVGEKQGEIGERMGKLGEEMGKIGEQQGKLAEEASRKMKAVLDQAIKDGKAKPVD